MKNNNITIFIVVLVVVVGLFIGILLNNKPKEKSDSQNNVVNSEEVSKGNTQTSDIQVGNKIISSNTPIMISDVPVPTSDPYIEYPSVVYQKTDEKFSATFPGGAGDWPKSIKLNVFKVVEGKNLEGAWDDIKVGQHIRIKIIKPGVEGSLYIKM